MHPTLYQYQQKTATKPFSYNWLDFCHLSLKYKIRLEELHSIYHQYFIDEINFYSTYSSQEVLMLNGLDRLTFLMRQHIYRLFLFPREVFYYKMWIYGYKGKIFNRIASEIHRTHTFILQSKASFYTVLLYLLLGIQEFVLLYFRN